MAYIELKPGHVTWRCVQCGKMLPEAHQATYLWNWHGPFCTQGCMARHTQQLKRDAERRTQQWTAAVEAKFDWRIKW